MSTKRSTRSSAASCASASSAPNSGAQRQEHLLPLANLNPYITCPLCDGYFIDATTVIDCLHTFCKSCLLNYFEDNNDCPKCHFMIHQSHPSHYVSFDRTMQDIVYKLVPGMQQEEQRRRELFTGEHSVEFTNGEAPAESGEKECERPEPPRQGDGQCCSGENHRAAHRRADEAVFIHLVPGNALKSIERQYVRLSAFATVNTVKRLLAYMLQNGDITKYNSYDVFCRNELMGRDYSMSFIRKTRWRDKAPDEPLTLIYREHVEF